MLCRCRQFVFVSLSLSFAAALPGFAEENFLRQGIDAYNKGKYSEATGLLGEALATDGENPVLHYYMANALLKMDMKPDAIREYKMARDLQPQGQLARYCDTALRTLEAITPKASSKTSPAADKVEWKQPQLISIFSDDPLSLKLEPLVEKLHAQYHERVAFIRISQNSAEAKDKELIGKYKITTFPTVLLIDSQGKLAKQYTELISLPQLEEDVGAMAPTQEQMNFSNKSEAEAAKFRTSEIDSVYERIKQYQSSLDNQLRDIDRRVNDDIDNLPRYYGRMGGYYFASQSEQIKEEGEKKKQALKDEFERKKAEWFAQAEKKIGTQETSSKSYRSAGKSK